LKVLTLDNIQINTIDYRFYIPELRSIHAVNSKISGFSNAEEFFKTVGNNLKKFNMSHNKLGEIPEALIEHC